MPTPQAVRAMVTLPGSVIRRNDGPAAMAADERFFPVINILRVMRLPDAGHVVLRAKVCYRPTAGQTVRA